MYICIYIERFSIEGKELYAKRVPSNNKWARGKFCFFCFKKKERKKNKKKSPRYFGASSHVVKSS